MSFILLNFAKNSIYIFVCAFMLCACSANKKHRELGVFENIKQEFVGTDFSKKTSILVFSDSGCSSTPYQLAVAQEKIKPNTQILGLYLKMNPKGQFGYQTHIDNTKNEIKWASMKNRKLFGLISECTKSNASPFIVEIKNNQITNVKSAKDTL